MPRLETSDFSSTSLWTEQLQGAETLSSQLRGSGRAPGDTWQSRQLLRTGNKGRPSHTEADAPERCQAPAPPPPPGLPNCHLLLSPPLTCCPAQTGVLRKTLPVARIPPTPSLQASVVPPGALALRADQHTAHLTLSLPLAFPENPIFSAHQYCLFLGQVHPWPG